jgi:hypothetical protein
MGNINGKFHQNRSIKVEGRRPCTVHCGQCSERDKKFEWRGPSALEPSTFKTANGKPKPWSGAEVKFEAGNFAENNEAAVVVRTRVLLRRFGMANTACGHGKQPQLTQQGYKCIVQDAACIRGGDSAFVDAHGCVFVECHLGAETKLRNKHPDFDG